MKLILLKQYSLIIVFILCLLGENAIAQTWVRKLAGFGFWGLEKDYAGNLWAGTSGSARGIFKSTDGGENWTNMYPASAANHVDIAADSLGNVFVTSGSQGLLKSVDGGVTFTMISPSNFNNKTLNTVACGRNGIVYAGATTGGVFVSIDTGNTFTSTALQTYSIVSLAVDKFNSNIVYAGASSTSLNGFFKSTDGGFTFGTSTNPVNVWGIIQDNIGTLFTVSTSASYPFCRSTDFGETWDTLANIPAAMRGGTIDLNGNLYAAGNGGVYRSTDGGHNFYHLGHSVSSSQIVNWNDKILVASTGTTAGGVYIFQDPSVPVELSSFTVSLIDNDVELRWSTVSEKNNRGFNLERQVSSTSAFRLTQGGASLSTSKQIAVCNWESIGFVSGAGTSTDEQNYVFTDKNIFDGRYSYRLKQIDFDGSFIYSNEVEIDVNLLDGFVLYQNYPNPFNPSTKIKFTIPNVETGHTSTSLSNHAPSLQVSLKVYDILGKEVTMLVNEEKEPGIYEVEFGADQTAKLFSGIYFYQLRAGEFVATKKFVVLK